VATTESHSLHLGDVILKMPVRVRDAAVQALSYMLHQR
jgi:hypothetical protein